jgi:hypothetical protein
MLFAEYPIVDEKFQMSDTFVYAAKTGNRIFGSSWLSDEGGEGDRQISEK